MKTIFFRKNHIIRTFTSSASFTDEVCQSNGHPSINAAKRRSRALQAANGGMGRGSLRVVEKLPESVPEEMFRA